MIQFCMYIHGTSLSFNGRAVQGEFELLEYLFSTGTGPVMNISGSRSLLEEIRGIESGDREMDESWGLRDWQPTGNLIIRRDKTLLEIREQGKRLELPTSEFRTLVETWIKFVEVNTAAFLPPNDKARS
jgi:hypothetical protein